MHELADRLVAHVAGDLALHDPAGGEAAGHERALGGGEDATDPVAAEQGLAGGGPDLAEHHERAVLRLAAEAGALVVVLGPAEEQQVGEAEVGQQAPGRDEALQVVDLGERRVGCGAGRARRGWPSFLLGPATRVPDRGAISPPRSEMSWSKSGRRHHQLGVPGQLRRLLPLAGGDDCGSRGSSARSRAARGRPGRGRRAARAPARPRRGRRPCGPGRRRPPCSPSPGAGRPRPRPRRRTRRGSTLLSTSAPRWQLALDERPR